MEEWNFENWGVKYWSKTPEFMKQEPACRAVPSQGARLLGKGLLYRRDLVSRRFSKKQEKENAQTGASLKGTFKLFIHAMSQACLRHAGV